MDRSTVITLIGSRMEQDDYGVWKSIPTSREVYAQVDSVTRAEFFEGGRNGLNPEFKFTMFSGDYNREIELVYEGEHYSIYRSYHGRNDKTELYAERKGGTNAQRNI